MIKLSDIKLIIWDLDDTFWNGTLSEGEVSTISNNVQFIYDTCDMGIMNSICSKNDFLTVKNKLQELGLWEYFIFPSIDWTAKGERIKEIISKTKLREENILFIDDNQLNLQEAKYYCPHISVLLPENLIDLYQEAKNALKTDKLHKRLKQYHLLEEKETYRSQYKNNEEFLYACDIKVSINKDCINQIDRIHDLVMRSNQLNFTKNRQTKDELISLVSANDIECGYVSVSDKFGDYGIVGFYAIHNYQLIHFVFSCRTLGMQIEQYVYEKIGCPLLNVVGEVVTKLEKGYTPQWINQKDQSKLGSNKNVITKLTNKILLKGPCDMQQMYTFLNSCENIKTEFTYVNDNGVSIEGHNHTSQIVTALYASEKEKKEMINNFSFFDNGMLDTLIRTEKFDYIVISMLTDGNLGIYRNKKNGYSIALCEKKYDVTNNEYAKMYIDKEIFTSGISFNSDIIEKFQKNYEYVDNKNGEVTINNLEKILEFIDPNTKIILLLGSEREFTKKCKISYENRHVEHRIMNDAIKKWAAGKNNVILLPFDKYIKNQNDFTDTINHFVKRVYYDLANDLVHIFNNDNINNVTIKGKKSIYVATIVQKMRLLKNKLFKHK